ncbi:Uncharacterised protein [Legionella wadsworthii]|uniref:Secreted protein n=1 Tax=Legionella wadsworthii TaxID=28088 RepID=A0A378LUX8_9GAMM|nr:hypothetical protein [Legionella wadsworthii]STY31218.1 Uncharacterised protein [Legionella wadsworthii]
MTRILICLCLTLISNVLIADSKPQSDSNLTPCFNMHEIEQIGKQTMELLQQEFCEHKVNPKEFAAISQNILPKIMTQSFLGVAPPENWQQLSDDIIKNCIDNKNLCQKQARKDFATCIQPKIPLLLVQFGPWLAQNCTALNNSFIQQWPEKKERLKKTINENKRTAPAFVQ